MKHYITYFSLIAFHFSLNSCHTQQSSVMTAGTGVDSVKVHEEMINIHLSDSLLQECIFQADSLSFVAHADSSVQIVARNATFASRKSKVKEEKVKVCIEDTTSVHIRDTTAVKNQVDRQAVYEPPDIRSILIVFGLFFISYLIFSRR